MGNNLSWRFSGNELKYLTEILTSGFKASSDGAFSTRLEESFASVHNQDYAIAFNSGTSTLHSILIALGVGAGDEVLVPSLTPLMCGLAIHYTGATPVYIDVDLGNFLINPELLEKNITEKTKAILVVHMYGGVCDMERIMKIANKHHLRVIEDCAQCFMGKDSMGRMTGTIGHAASWSFENSKQLTCGDGGIVTTNDSKLATHIRKIGGLGFKTLTAKSGKVRTDKDKLQNPNWERFDTIGYNYRINQMAAAVALAQLERWEHFLNLRKLAGKHYSDTIIDSNILMAQQNIPNSENTFFTFSCRINPDSGVAWADFRSKFMELGGDGIYAAAKLLYQEPIFSKLKIGRNRTPVAEKLQLEILNLTTNQSNETEIIKQNDILRKTLKFFGDS